MVSSVELDDMIDDDIQYSIKKSRQSNACQLQEMLYQQSLQGSEFCDVTLSIGNTVRECLLRRLSYSSADILLIFVDKNWQCSVLNQSSRLLIVQCTIYKMWLFKQMFFHF